MNDLKTIRAKRATQLIFLVCGLGIASWAPMVPFAKDRLLLNEANLGMLLLFLGAGAILMMPISGILIRKIGSRKVIAASVVLSAFILPCLLVISNVYLMGLFLFAFGCGIGTIDVAMNTHGVQVQNLYDKPIMSSLHGLFSVGGLFGSLGLGFLMKMGLNPIYAAITISSLLILLLITQYKNLFTLEKEQEIILKSASEDKKEESKGKMQWLDYRVLVLGLMCFIVFLSEGAMLDWSAIFLRDNRGIENEFTGIGYAAFSVAMAAMRLSGDSLVGKLNSKIIVVGGSILAAIGIGIIVLSPWLLVSILGFVLLGAGAANIVPVFITEGGKIKGISPTVTIPVITTLGYAGQLAGPALLGIIAHYFSLSIAFEIIALLFILVATIYQFRKK
ncbi:MFS transporter [Chryseobacterium polytrichastri]|uniref:Major Facilitator Superfamily protein n=1 Tax=Chryseobacterium polytrichastri TaxID=1302687 RepID=A0A1M6Y5Q9_9FLAO|nr:MFS transporter [Chryseobacterium polytrichastri]SHL13557.1 Major Facilitator Superfamily protein [Chryseobacterium polytrichastri]